MSEQTKSKIGRRQAVTAAIGAAGVAALGTTQASANMVTEQPLKGKKVLVAIGHYFMKNGLPIGAMCHGPQVVYSAHSVKSRKMTSFSGIRSDIELAGAKYIDEPTVVDGNLVTSRGWPDLPDFMPKFLKVLAVR